MTHFVSTRYTRPFVSSRPNSPLRVQTWAWCWQLECISSRNYMNVIVYYIAARQADFMSVSKTKTNVLSTTAWLYIDISKDFVMRCTLPVNTGACLSRRRVGVHSAIRQQIKWALCYCRLLNFRQQNTHCQRMRVPVWVRRTSWYRSMSESDMCILVENLVAIIHSAHYICIRTRECRCTHRREPCSYCGQHRTCRTYYRCRSGHPLAYDCRGSLWL